VKAGDAPAYALAYPGGGIVEDGGGYAADFCGEKVAGAGEVCEGRGVGKGGAEDGFSRAVVRGGVKGEEARVEGMLDDGESGEGFGRGVVLVVEGGCAEGQGGNTFGDGGAGGGIGWAG